MSTDGSGELTKPRDLTDWLYAYPDGRNVEIEELRSTLRDAFDYIRRLLNDERAVKAEVARLQDEVDVLLSRLKGEAMTDTRLTREEFAENLHDALHERERSTSSFYAGAGGHEDKSYRDALLAHDAAQREEIERLAGALERSRDYVSDEALGSESQEYRDASFAVLAEIDAALADSKQRTREWEERASNARNDAARLRKALEEKP